MNYLKCLVCGNKYPLCGFLSHIRAHINYTQYKCRNCQFACTTDEDAVVHQFTSKHHVVRQVNEYLEDLTSRIFQDCCNAQKKESNVESKKTHKGTPSQYSDDQTGISDSSDVEFIGTFGSEQLESLPIEAHKNKEPEAFKESEQTFVERQADRERSAVVLESSMRNKRPQTVEASSSKMPTVIEESAKALRVEEKCPSLSLHKGIKYKESLLHSAAKISWNRLLRKRMVSEANTTELQEMLTNSDVDDLTEKHGMDCIVNGEQQSRKLPQEAIITFKQRSNIEMRLRRQDLRMLNRPNSSDTVEDVRIVKKRFRSESDKLISLNSSTQVLQPKRTFNLPSTPLPKRCSGLHEMVPVEKSEEKVKALRDHGEHGVKAEESDDAGENRNLLPEHRGNVSGRKCRQRIADSSARCVQQRTTSCSLEYPNETEKQKVMSDVSVMETQRTLCHKCGMLICSAYVDRRNHALECHFLNKDDPELIHLLPATVRACFPSFAVSSDFQCNECGKELLVQRSRRYHVLKKHLQVRLKCVVHRCMESAESIGELKRHIMTAHGKGYLDKAENTDLRKCFVEMEKQFEKQLDAKIHQCFPCPVQENVSRHVNSMVDDNRGLPKASVCERIALLVNEMSASTTTQKLSKTVHPTHQSDSDSDSSSSSSCSTSSNSSHSICRTRRKRLLLRKNISSENDKNDAGRVESGMRAVASTGMLQACVRCQREMKRGRMEADGWKNLHGVADISLPLLCTVCAWISSPTCKQWNDSVQWSNTQSNIDDISP